MTLDLAMIEGRGRERKEKSGSGHWGGHGLVLPPCPQPHLRVLLDLELSLQGLQSPRRKPFRFQSYGPTLALHSHNCHCLSVKRLGLVSVPTSRAQHSAGYRQGIGSEFADHLDGNGLPFPQPEHWVFETRWRRPWPLLWLEGLYL